MRKALLALVIVALAVGLVVLAGPALIRRDNASRVRRAQGIVDALEQLEIGKSGHSAADAIAKKFGIGPSPYLLPKGRYPKENCAAPDHLDSCSYILRMNNSPVEAVFLNHPDLPRLGVPEWWGSAHIDISNGTVETYSFSIWYKASNGRWRGFASDTRQSLPRFEPNQAHISDSYSVRCLEIRQEAAPRWLGLASALTPAANADERRRALHIDFSCLGQRSGCGEVCDVMPEAWEDFYAALGRSEAEKLGPDYRLCNRRSN